MSGHTRLYLPEYAYHVVQRVNNREACFLSLRIISFIWSCGKKLHHAKVFLFMLIV
jgi:REP element-mobilizing transposase RayT